MRYVVNTSEVFELWAKQEQNRANTPKNYCYFTGNTCYSYGSHFPIAKILPDGKNCLFTLKGYSNSTENHKNYAYSAAKKEGFNLIYCYDIENVEKSMLYWQNQITDLISQIKYKLNRKFEGRVQSLKHHAKTAQRYIDFMQCEIPFEMAVQLNFILNTSSEDIVKKLRD